MGLTITYLGHSAFTFTDGSHTLVVDPFLTGNPVASCAADDVKCEYIALTHGHADHVGDTVAIAKANDATVIGAFEICEWAGEQGIAKCEPGNPGGRITTAFGSVAFTQAFHSSSYEGRYMGMPCGLMIEMGGSVVYHAGDTALFGDMQLIGELYKPAVSILPIGDRFTMGVEHASRAAEMIGAPVMIPCHYNTWPPIETDPRKLDPEGICVGVMQPGESREIA